MQYKEIEQKESIKQLAEKQAQPAQQFPQKNSKKILIILIIIVIVVIAVVVLWLVLKENPNNGNGGGNGGTGGGTTLTGSFEEKLKMCLEKNDFSIECSKLFVDPELYKDCEKLGELRDKCLYRIATAGRFDLCEDISDTNLKNKCKEEMLQLPIIHNE